jgi:hypothetical protein
MLELRLVRRIIMAEATKLSESEIDALERQVPGVAKRALEPSGAVGGSVV